MFVIMHEQMTSVNSYDTIQIHLGYNLLIFQMIVPINGCLVKQKAMASGCNHQSKLPLFKRTCYLYYYYYMLNIAS